MLNAEKLVLRKVLYDIIDRAFQAARVSAAACRIEDRGDGVLIVVPSHIPESRLVGVWIEEMYQALRTHNGRADGPGRVRLRIGMHSGQVHADTHGVAGADVELACRLGESAAARATLDLVHAAHLVVVVSESVYHSVVRHGGRFIEPESYRSVRARMKETDTTGWVMVPGYSVPPIPDGVPEPQDDAAGTDDATPAPGQHSAATSGRAQISDIHHTGAVIGTGTFTAPFVIGTLDYGTQNGHQ